MEKITKLNGKEVPTVYIDPEMDKYNNIILFPEKLERAKKNIKNSNLLEFLKTIEDHQKAESNK